MASITARSCTKWDLENFIQTDPALSTAERYVAHKLLKQLDGKFRPLDHKLASQSLIGHWIRCARESVNRAYRKLRVLGYFRTRWITVNRKTAQGIKGVTRVQVTLGPVLRRLAETGRTDGHVSAAQAHGVTLHHPSPPLPGSPGTVSGDVDANSADRKGGCADLDRESKRKAIAEWPRLAGARPILANNLPSSRSAREANMAYYDPAGYRQLLEHLDDEASEDELADQHLALLEARHAAARRGAAAARELLQRRQPRKLPRSRRK